jgi:hypothetical protein
MPPEKFQRALARELVRGIAVTVYSFPIDVIDDAKSGGSSEVCHLCNDCGLSITVFAFRIALDGR